MDIAQRVSDGWGLGPVLETRDLGGSGACWLVVTGHGRYVYKQVGRTDFVAIYDKVQKVLNESGLLQAKVLPAKGGQLVEPDGFSLLEYIPGDAPSMYTDDQFVAIVEYLSRFNRTLQSVPFRPDEMKTVNAWDEVRSTEFACDQAAALAAQPLLDQPARALLQGAERLLRASIDTLKRMPKQLIHGDPGPGNIIFDGSRVRAIIDFTPDYENELYSLAQFLYWTCLWEWEQPRSEDRIEEALQIYPAQGSREILSAYLLKACVFRIVGPALNGMRSGTLQPGKLSRRLSALERLISTQIPDYPDLWPSL